MSFSVSAASPDHDAPGCSPAARRYYGFAGAGADAGAVSVAAEGCDPSISDAWRRELGTTRNKAIAEMDYGKDQGKPAAAILTIARRVWVSRHYSSVGYCALGSAAYRHCSRMATIATG